MKKNPLLILGCSARKRCDDEEITALERYDGPAFRVLRRFKREFSNPDLEVWVLSARFGLLDGQTLVPFYEQRLTHAGSQVLLSSLQSTWSEYPLRHLSRQIFIDAGAQYRAILEKSDVRFTSGSVVEWATGGPGIRSTQLRSWLLTTLHSGPPKQKIEGANQSSIPQYLEATFLGESYVIEAVRLIELALQWDESQSHLQTSLWRVAIYTSHGLKVVPLKWLVSCLVGLRPSAFSTSQAKSFLRKLGLQNAIFCDFPKNRLRL